MNDYTKGKIAEIDRDIEDWTKTLALLDTKPEIKMSVIDQYNGLRQKIEDWKKIKVALINLWEGQTE